MVIREEKTYRIMVEGRFFEEGTEDVSKKMPESFMFRGTTEQYAKVGIHFMRGSDGQYITNLVIETRHYIPEESNCVSED